MNALTQVEFHGDTLWAVEAGGDVFIVIKPICERLGLLWHKQVERIKRDAVLSEGAPMMGVPSPGGVQETTLLRLDLVNGWLFGIDDSRVKDEETRQRVLTYKRECYRVLFEHFFAARATEPEAGPAEPRPLLPGNADFAEAVRLVREARLSRGKEAALALWRSIGLPWVPELEPRRPAGLDINDEDAVTAFARDGIEAVRGVVTPAAMLWPAFCAYCARGAYRNPGQSSFMSRFGRMGYSKRKVGGRMVYYGIRPVEAGFPAEGSPE